MMGTWNKGALEIKMTMMIIVGIPRKKFGCFVNSSFRKRRRKEERHRLWNGKNVCQRLQIEKTIKTTDWYIRESNYRYVRCISKDTFDTIEAYLRKQDIGAKVVCKISDHVHPVHNILSFNGWSLWAYQTAGVLIISQTRGTRGVWWSSALCAGS